jgi:hypothetical protein
MLIDAIDSDIKVCGEYKSHPQARSAYARTKGNKYVHRVVMARVLGRHLERNEKVDHINGNGLDNRRCNLRVVTHAENLANRPGWKQSSSKYKGVTFFKRDQKWQAKICPKGKTIHLGYFEDEKEAAHEYNKAAILHFGEMAVLNPIGA